MIIDSGVWQNVISERIWFYNVQQTDGIVIELANVNRSSLKYGGDVKTDTGMRHIIMRSTYYIPGLRMNLLSCSKLNEHKIMIRISEGTSILTDQDNGNCLGKLSRAIKDKLHHLKTVHLKQPSPNKNRTLIAYAKPNKPDLGIANGGLKRPCK